MEIVPAKSNLVGPPGSSRATSATSSSNTLSVSVSDGAIELKCRTAGSRPAPAITWWKGNKQIVPAPIQSTKSTGNNSSNSSSSSVTSITVTVS